MILRTTIATLTVIFLGMSVVTGCAGQSGDSEVPGGSVEAPDVGSPGFPPGADAASVLGEFARNADGYADVAVGDLARMMPDKAFTLVNVHVPDEGSIPGTDVSIPFDRIADHLDELPSDTGAPLVLYCRSGRMSTEAATALAALGYTNVMELDGGFVAWEEAGYTLDR